MRISDPWARRLLGLLRPRAKRLPDFVDLARPFLSDTVEYEAEAIESIWVVPGWVRMWRRSPPMQATDPFDEPHVEAAVRGTAADRVSRPECSSMPHAWQLLEPYPSPGLFEVLALLGRERTVARLERLVNFLATAPRADFPEQTSHI